MLNTTLNNYALTLFAREREREREAFCSSFGCTTSLIKKGENNIF